MKPLSSPMPVPSKDDIYRLVMSPRKSGEVDVIASPFPDEETETQGDLVTWSESHSSRAGGLVTFPIPSPDFQGGAPHHSSPQNKISPWWGHTALPPSRGLGL